MAFLLITKINSAQIAMWFGQIKSRLQKIEIKKQSYFLVTEGELLALLEEAPKFEQPILSNITPFIAEQVVELADEKDWNPLNIAIIASRAWESLNIHTPTHVVGGMLLARSRSIINKKLM